MTTTNTTAVRMSDLTKDYLGGSALGPFDLEIVVGQRVSLVGHNGSGKSTLLKLLAGVIEPTRGSAQIAGHVTGSLLARAALSYVPDDPVFYDDLSVWEHLEYVARLHHTDDWEDYADRLAHILGLDEHLADLPTTFSRGLRQRTQLALGFVRPFEIIMIDEPYFGLDRDGRDALAKLLHWAHGDGATVIIATNDPSTVGATDRLIALRDGRVAYDGKPGHADLIY